MFSGVRETMTLAYLTQSQLADDYSTDNGASYIMLPRTMAESYYKMQSPSQVKEENGKWLVRCDSKLLPLSLKVSGEEIQISGRRLYLRFKNNKQLACK